MQPGLRVIPGKWSIPRTAGGSSADKLEHLWSESPNSVNMMPTVYVYYCNLTPFIWKIHLISFKQAK